MPEHPESQTVPVPADDVDPLAVSADLSPDEIGRPLFERFGPEGRTLIAVAAGGALGTLSRYGIAQAVPAGNDGFPWSTWSINVTGALFLGVLLTVLTERRPPTPYLRALLGTGFAGGYTTWSTFMVDTDQLVRHHHVAVAAIYVVASLIAGLGAVQVGIWATRRLPPSLPAGSSGRTPPSGTASTAGRRE